MLWFKVVSGAYASSAMQQRTARQKRDKYGYAKEYVAIVAGHIRKSEKKHAYTERGQKCAKAYIKRYTTQVIKLARQCSYIV